MRGMSGISATTIALDLTLFMGAESVAIGSRLLTRRRMGMSRRRAVVCGTTARRPMSRKGQGGEEGLFDVGLVVARNMMQADAFHVDEGVELLSAVRLHIEV